MRSKRPQEKSRRLRRKQRRAEAETTEPESWEDESREDEPQEDEAAAGEEVDWIETGAAEAEKDFVPSDTRDVGPIVADALEERAGPGGGRGGGSRARRRGCRRGAGRPALAGRGWRSSTSPSWLTPRRRMTSKCGKPSPPRKSPSSLLNRPGRKMKRRSWRHRSWRHRPSRCRRRTTRPPSNRRAPGGRPSDPPLPHSLGGRRHRRDTGYRGGTGTGGTGPGADKRWLPGAGRNGPP